MAEAALFSDVYAPQLYPLGFVASDNQDRTGTELPAGGVSRTTLFNDVYAPRLYPLGIVASDNQDRTGTELPAGGVSRTTLFNDVYAPKLGSMTRISAFSLTSNETIVIGSGSAPVQTTQRWYMG